MNLCGETGRLGTIPATGPVCIQNCHTHLHWSVPIPADVQKTNILTPSRGYEATSYQTVLQAKMAELQDLVEAHITESAHRQKVDYDRHSEERQFKAGDLVWLSVPTAGKLDPQ